MTTTELKKIAEQHAALGEEWGSNSADRRYLNAFNPATVLKLLGDYEKMKTALEECASIDIDGVTDFGMNEYRKRVSRQCLASLEMK